MDSRTARSHRPDAIRKAILWALLPTLVLVLIAPSVGYAQVATNITPTTGAGNLGTTVTQAGNHYDITGGTRPGDVTGANLFHSFGDFSVGAGDIGNFLNNTGLPTSNILGRVTGGNISNIYGTIQTTDFGNANLFLVNPSGIVFGPNGSVNVGGSVSFTTAQYLRMFDGVNSANFYANPANDGLANSVLAVAPVVDFGFLSPAAYGFLTAPGPNATITVQGSALSVLSAPADTPPNSISLVGGKVVIEGGVQLLAPSGRILLATSASPGEFDVNTLQALQNVDGASFTSFGTVSLAPGSSVDVSGTSTVFIKGGQLVLSVNDATLTTSESPAPSDTVSLSLGSSFVTSNSGAEPGANVQITVGSLQADGAMVQTVNAGDGDGGNISINSTTVSLTNGATFSSSTGLDFTTFVFGGSGKGGNITTNVGTLALTNGAAIRSNTFSPGLLGQGGNVTVQGLQGLGSAADSVTLSNGATINTATALGLGPGGAMSITADTLIIEDASEVSTDTCCPGDFGGGSGVGGGLSLNVETLTLKGGINGGSKIRSTDFTGTDVDSDNHVDLAGKGGDVTIQGVDGGAANLVELSGGSQILVESVSGDGGRLSLAATSLNLEGADTAINSSATGIGNGGDIVLRVGKASLSAGATIASRTVSSALDAGAGGTITMQGLQGDGLKAESLTLAGLRSGIISDSIGGGLPGDIAVHAETVSLTNGAVIEGGKQDSNGTGGNVFIDADSVDISSNISSSIFERSHISSQAFALSAGKVTIKADQLTLINGSIVTTTRSEFGGRGGDVQVDVGTVSLTDGASINSQSGSEDAPFSTGRAGNITMTGESLTLANHAEITSSSKGTVADAGDAGNVMITLSGAFTSNASTIATSAENARGGDILINAQNVQLSTGTLISANSNAPLLPDGAGDAGNITIQSGSTVLLNNSALTTDA